MVTQERMVRETVRIPTPTAPEPRRDDGWRNESLPGPAEQPARPGLLSRLFWASVGFGLAATGFALALTVFLAFIGVPLFIFGLALMQSQAE